MHTPLQLANPRGHNPEPLPVQLVVVPSSGEFVAGTTCLSKKEGTFVLTSAQYQNSKLE